MPTPSPLVAQAKADAERLIADAIASGKWSESWVRNNRADLVRQLVQMSVSQARDDALRVGAVQARAA